MPVSPKILVAPDSFKESMSALKAGEAIARGVHAVWPEANVSIVPMADGGEGTLEALISGGHFEEVTCVATTAYGEKRVARFGWQPASRVAVIEAAEAAGLEHAPSESRNIWVANSFGVGELIRSALNLRPSKVYLTLGGTATNDGGAGMLAALGVKFLDEARQELSPIPDTLRALHSVDLSGLDPRVSAASFELAVDVSNPLIGEEGASAVFGPQKGATPEDVQKLDMLLARIAYCVNVQTGIDRSMDRGAGAAGGIGWAALETLNGTARPGVEMVADIVGLSEAMEGSNLVITGEGRADGQTLAGKTAYGVATIAKSQGIPVLLLAGSLLPGAEALLDHGIVAIVPTLRDLAPLPEQLLRGAERLEQATETSIRLINFGQDLDLTE